MEALNRQFLFALSSKGRLSLTIWINDLIYIFYLFVFRVWHYFAVALTFISNQTRIRVQAKTQ